MGLYAIEVITVSFGSIGGRKRSMSSAMKLLFECHEMVILFIEQ